MDDELQACLRRVNAGLSFSQPEGGTWNVRWDLALSRTRGAHLVRLPLLRLEP